MILSAIAGANESEKTRSDLFDTLKAVISEISSSMDDLSAVDFSSINLIHVVFLVFIVAFMISLYFFLKEIFELHGNNKTKPNHPSLINNILPESAWLVFTSGVAIYYLGYAYGGTADNVATLTLRSILSAFEMFLSKSNLIGIADNCKADSVYMLCFAIIHASAVMVSMIFAVACFGKRVLDWGRSIIWQYFSSCSELNVFWGLNEKNILLAKNIYKTSEGKKRIIFVDIPNGSNESKTGQSFSGIMGLLSYKSNVAKQISNIKYILLRSSSSPDSIDVTSKGIFRNMNIGKLAKLINKTKYVNNHILTNNDESNKHAAINLLDSEIGNKINRVYCSAENTKEIALLAACSNGKLQIIDDSRAAIMEFAMRKNEKGEYPAHPINFVDVNSTLGCVNAEKPFTAFIVGFGTTGQEALRFLYEFSAFSDSKGDKTPVEFHVFDNSINEIKGELYQEIPALPELERSNELIFHPCNASTTIFNEKLHALIDNLNYVVIATGEDERNLHIASMIYEYALQNRQVGFDKFKIFVRLYNSNDEYKFKKIIDTYGANHFPAIEYFGNPENIYTREWILDDKEGEMAEQFYKSYCIASKEEYKSQDKRREDEISKEPTRLLGYRRIDRKLTQDKANCKHCYTKEILLGLHDMPHVPEIPGWPFAIETGKPSDIGKMEWYKRLINVSICEHLRWNASHLMMGYMPMTLEEAKKIKNSCNEKSKRHFCIANWNELPQVPDYKEYDYMVVLTTINLYYEIKRQSCKF